MTAPLRHLRQIVRVLAVVALLGPVRAQAQACHGVAEDSLVTRPWNAPLDRRISFQAHDTSLRDALDHLAVTARIRLSYSGELLPLSRVECINVVNTAVGDVLVALLHGATVSPIIVGPDQVALAPRPASVAPTDDPSSPTVGVLERVVVTGTATGGAERPLTVAMDVVDGRQLARRNARTLSDALDGAVPGVWAWAQSPSSLFTSYGSIRGASSFGLSYPKIYIDGIEVANPLVVSRFNPDAIDHIEVIRGPQGAALYGTDAISGVVNIVTRHEGVDVGGDRLGVRAAAGMTSSDFAAHGILTQDHALSVRTGSATRSAGLDVSGGSMGNFVPNAYSSQLMASGNGRVIGARTTLLGTARYFTQRAGTPANPLIVRSPLPPADTGNFARSDSTPQSVTGYTVGGTATFAQNERWTHSILAGVDGYSLSNVASNETPLRIEADSALRAAEGKADRASVRVSSVAHFASSEARSATLTFAAEHATLREATRGTARFAPDGHIGGTLGNPQQVVKWENTLGLTAQATAALDNTLFLTAGARLERNAAFSTTDHFATLPMLGAAMVRDAGPWTIKVRSAYGKGIRPPQTTTHAIVWQSNQRASTQPTLGPEEQSGIEVGADILLGDVLTVKLTRFDQRASGLIQQVAVSTDSTEGGMTGGPGGGPMKPPRIWYSLQNVGEITNRGFEAQASTRVRSVSFDGSWTSVNSRVASVAPGYTGDLRAGDRMLAVPAHTASLNATVDRRRWSASIGATRAWDWINYDRLALAQSYVNSTRYSRDLVGSSLRDYWRQYDGSTRLRATATRQLRPGFELEMTGDNLLGYQRGEPDNVTLVPGRTMLTGLRVRF